MPRIDVLTLFPRMLDGFLAESILGKGLERALLAVVVHDLRRWTTDKHRTADDRPFGGGSPPEGWGNMPRIDVLTLFPRMLDGFLDESILGKGLERALLAVVVHDLRRWTTGKQGPFE